MTMLLWILLLLNAALALGNVPQTEINALHDLYTATNGLHWAWASSGNKWNFTGNPNPCSPLWQGVQCTASTTSDPYQHVYKLTLNSYLLRGTLPSSLSSLTHMTSLSLKSNALNGTIPSSFGSLPALQTLHLGYNHLTGTIPASLGNIKTLNFIYLYVNWLHGTVPPQFGNLTNLGGLELDVNYLTGTIPSSLGKLARLQSLQLYSNQLDGTIPAEIGHLLHLATLNLLSNSLHGSIPASIGNLTKLQKLDLSGNQISGEVPSTLGRLPYLTTITLSFNRLVGTIPSSLGALTRLQWIDIGNNSFDGPIPAELGQLTSLNYLDASNNTLTGPIPSAIGNCAQLGYLILQFNRLTGPIPPQLGNLTVLTTMLVMANRLTGPIPNSISRLRNLQVLNLGENQLQGTVPLWLEYSTALQQLDLSHCQLSGTLPAFLFEMGALTVLTLDGNSLTGPLPILSKLSEPTLRKTSTNNALAPLYIAITTLDLRSNAFTGPIPEWLIASLLDVSSLDFGSNRLTGPLPDTFHNLTRLSNIDFSGNQLTGTLPHSVCALPALTIYNMHNNRFTGTIPTCLGSLPALSSLLLSHNLLTSTVPGLFTSLPALTRLYIDSNLFTGTVPDVVVGSNLTDLSAGYNFLIGTVPASIGNARYLQFLQLSSNRFSGTLPAALGDLKSLQLLWISNATITGCIPTSLALMPSLVQIFLDDNALQCSLDGVFNASVQRSLSDIRIDGNQITGALPGELFRLPALRSFVAIGNCLSGTLPAAICESTSLTSLILDGLHSATACRTEVFALTNSYVAGTGVHGSIPACLLNMSTLVSLHLSGNSLSGTLSDAVGMHMRDITLSHNLLSGTLPTAFQQRGWENFDVSYNRLSGELADDFGDYVISVVVDFGNLTNRFTFPFHGALENNRFSGKVPPASVQLANISALGSNMFSCKADKSDLPQADSDRDNYQCGSDSFDTPYYIFITIAAAVGLLLLYAVVSKTRYADVALHLASKWSAAAEAGPRAWRQVLNMSEILCAVGVGCTVLIILLLVRWYAAGSGSYGTYTHQYAWILSAAFLSGTTPAIVELFLFTIIMAVAVIGAYFVLVRKDSLESDQSEEKTRDSSAPAVSSVSTVPQVTNAAVYTIYLVANCVAVIGVNVAFLVIVLTQNNAVVTAAQVAISLFKLVWNAVCTPRLVRFATAFLPGARFTSTFVTVQLFIALLNNIAIPCLLVAVLSPSCFYTVFDAPPAVESTYYVRSCTSNEGEGVDCLSATPYPLTSSYSPPFRYSYQCSSSFVTYYAPAFVYLAITAGIVMPAVQVMALHLMKFTTSGGLPHKVLSKIVPPLLRYTAPAISSSTGVRNPVHSSGAGAATGAGAEQDGERGQHQPSTAPPQEVLCDANKLLAALVTYLGILLTFGVAFPPLAVAMCCAMLSAAWQEKLAVGRFLSAAREELDPARVGMIDQDCKGAASLTKFTKSIFLVVGLGCCFCALFLFDTLGDETGVDGAYWVLIVLPLLPLCAYLGLVLWCRHYGDMLARPLGLSIDSRVVQKQSRARDGAGEGMELGPVGKGYMHEEIEGNVAEAL